MKQLKCYLEKCPATLSVIITFFAIGLLFIAKIFETETDQLFNWPRLIILAFISICICTILSRCNWANSSGLSTSPSAWHRRWYIAVLPLLLIALLSSTSANWTAAEFSIPRLSAWILSNFSTGFFEEVLMRGLCFFILLKAWGSTKKGVYKAALFQAVVFGFAHLVNLYDTPAHDVIAQVLFATLIGIGFAGLVYLTRSLWPAILVHTAINSAGTVNQYLVPGISDFQSPGLSGYLVIIVIFFVLSVIPGLMYLRTSRPYKELKKG